VHRTDNQPADATRSRRKRGMDEGNESLARRLHDHREKVSPDRALYNLAGTGKFRSLPAFTAVR